MRRERKHELADKKKRDRKRCAKAKRQQAVRREKTITRIPCSGCGGNGRHTEFETAEYDENNPESTLCEECKRTWVFCSYCMTQTRAYDPADGKRFDPRESCPSCRVRMKQVRCVSCAAVREKMAQDDSEWGVCETCDREQREFTDRRTQNSPTTDEALLLGIAPPGTSDDSWFLDADLPALTTEQAEKVTVFWADWLLDFEEDMALGQVGGSGWFGRMNFAEFRLEAMGSIIGKERVATLYEEVKAARGFNYEAAERYRNAESPEETDAAFAEVFGDSCDSIKVPAEVPVEVPAEELHPTGVLVKLTQAQLEYAVEVATRRAGLGSPSGGGRRKKFSMRPEQAEDGGEEEG